MACICKNGLDTTHFDKRSIHALSQYCADIECLRKNAISLFWLDAHFAAKSRHALEAARCGDVAGEATPENFW
jgi:hypothetical protein